MTSSKPRRVYWDTGLFIAFLNKGEDERRKVCEHNLRHAQNGRIEIYTSYWTAVEVIKPKWIPKFVPLTEEQVEMIQKMFQWPFLKKVQVHQLVAFKAADLARKYGLKPADAIHAATALVKGVDAMQVFDRDFGAIASLIAIEEPTYLTSLPLLDAAGDIGPTPAKLEAASSPQLNLDLAPSTATEKSSAKTTAPDPPTTAANTPNAPHLPVSRSSAVEQKPTAPSPRPSTPKTPQRGSSRTAARRPGTKK